MLSPPKLVLSKGIASSMRKPLSPVSPQMMEDSPLELKKKTPTRYSPYLLKSALKNAGTTPGRGTNPSPHYLRVANLSGRKSPHNRLTPRRMEQSTPDSNRMNESPDADQQCIQLSTPPQILDINGSTASDRTFIEQNNVIRVKPIVFQAPTSSANEPNSPVVNNQTQTSFRSPFKTPSYYKKKQALAEDLGLAFEDSYSRSAKKNQALKNPFTPSSFKQIKVIPDKAFRMMVGNSHHQNVQTVVEEPKKKSLIRSMKDYRRNRKENLKSKLRGDSPKDYSSSTDSLKKRSPARKRKFDETDENLQGGATILSNLGAVLIDQAVQTQPTNVLMQDIEVEVESDYEVDPQHFNDEQVAYESPTKKIKAEHGRPLWSRLKKALTKKKSNNETDD